MGQRNPSANISQNTSDPRLADYLKSDRQWTREQRVSHAQYMRRVASTPEEGTFWKKVVRANAITNDERRAWAPQS